MKIEENQKNWFSQAAPNIFTNWNRPFEVIW